MAKARLIFGLLLLAAGCSGIATPAGTHDLPVTVTPTLTLPPTLQATATPPAQPTLVVWLPSQFAPVSASPAGEILRKRLDAFSALHPDVSVQVRVKALEGPGGLLDSLTTANAAAPLALPDLVALPRPLLETAALKGLLHPYDDLIDDPEDSGWYDYALELARLQDSLFGLPFAGDVLALIYRSAGADPSPPPAFIEALHGSGPLAFAAADPQALFTLALYQAAGGKILDAQGRPTLEKDPLTRVLAFYQAATFSELTPFWVTQFQSDDQSWDAFQKGQAEMVVTWASRYFAGGLQNARVAPLPTLDGKNFTLATGWVWALASPHPEGQRLAADLALFLSESEFLGDWTQANGYLPPRPQALDRWDSGLQRSFVRRVSESAHLIPSTDVLPALAAPLSAASIDILKQQSDPAAAAQGAVNSLLTP